MSDGISKTLFVVGIIIAILGASAISTVISMNYARGPKGDTGLMEAPGPRGQQGPIGPAVNFSIANMTGWLPAPSYVSEWVIKQHNQFNNFTHNLNTTEVLVLVQVKINRTAYPQFPWQNGTIVNAYNDAQWWLFENEIRVFLYDAFDGEWFRVMLWKISDP